MGLMRKLANLLQAGEVPAGVYDSVTGNWIFSASYTSNSTSAHAAIFQRSGGAVAAAIGYDDSLTRMYLGTTTAHGISFRTNNTLVGSIAANGAWTIGPSGGSQNTIFGGSLLWETTSAKGGGYVSTAANATYNGILFASNQATNVSPIAPQGNTGIASWYFDLGGTLADGSNTSSANVDAVTWMRRPGGSANALASIQYFGRIDNGGIWRNVTGTWGTISDIRFKTNIQLLSGSLEKILQLKPSTFDWIEEKQLAARPNTGFIAQELQGVFPEMVSVSQEDDIEDALSVSVAGPQMIAHLVKAIQELTARVAELEARP